MAAVSASRADAVARPGVWVAIAFLVAASLLGLLGRQFVVPGTDLAAVWPSAGVTVVWLLVRRAGPLSTDVALMFSSMVAFALVIGIALPQALALPVAHTLQSVVIAELLRRTLPELWGLGGSQALDSPRKLGLLLGCVGAGVLVSTVVGVSWLALAGEEAGLDLALLWFGRNAAGVIVAGVALLVVLQYLAQPRPRRPQWSGSLTEFAVACATSATLYGLTFWGDVHDMLFLLLGVVVWFGVRFGTVTNALHTLVVAHVAVSATLAGTGPFAHAAPIENVLLVQLFMLATAITGLALSTGSDERRLLNTDLVRRTEEMAYQARLMSAVVNSMAEGLAVVDDSGRWLLRNPAATKVGGLPGDLRALLSSAAGTEDPLARALAGETVRDMEIRVSDPPGEGRILAVSATPLPRDSVTGRSRALLIFRDATVEHARRVDLTAFAQVVAHDLRNPLAAVEGWTEMMAIEVADGDVDEALVRDYVDRVGTGTRRMKGLIDDLLSRATHDATLQLRRVDLEALTKEVASDHGANGHVVVGDIPDAHADPALVRQLLDNLLGNALKFVSPGGVPSITVTGRRTGSGTVAVSVTDAGIGVPLGEHERIFEQRHRAHASTYDGRGLGLAICRRIVERHAGSIVVRDNPAGGAVFEFTLPSPD